MSDRRVFIPTRRTILQTIGCAALAAGTTHANADAPNPVDRGAVDKGAVKFAPIAAPTEAAGNFDKPTLSDKDRVGFAVVALGRLSVEEILPAFAQTQKCKVTALVSGSPAKLTSIGARYGIPKESCYSYDDFERIAENEDVKVVYVVLPNSMHREFVERSAAGKKHVLCEKPMATNVADAQAMIAACANAKVKLMIAYRCRYEPHHLDLIDRARSGQFGKIKLIDAINAQNQGDPSQWRLRKALAGGGSLPDVGIYCLNAARAVTGEEPISIEARMETDSTDARFREVEDRVALLMKFPSGAIANLSTAYSIHRASRMAVHLDDASFVLEKAFPYQGQQLKLVRADGKLETETAFQIAHKNHFASEMDHMAECVLADRMPNTPGEEGLRDMVLMEAIYRSAADRSSVNL